MQGTYRFSIDFHPKGLPYKPIRLRCIYIAKTSSTCLPFIFYILELHICITCKIYNLSPVTLLILQPTHY